MPTSTYFPALHGGTAGEQGLIQDLVDEQIKLFGSDVKYIPRIMVQDQVMNDVTLSKSTTIYTVEMLLQNVEGLVVLVLNLQPSSVYVSLMRQHLLSQLIGGKK